MCVRVRMRVRGCARARARARVCVCVCVCVCGCVAAVWLSRQFQERPRGFPGRPKRPPGPLQEAFRMPRGSRRPPGSHLGPILLNVGPFWMQKPSPHRPADNCSRVSYMTPPKTRTLPRTGQKPLPTPLNDDNSCQQNGRAKPQNEGAAVDRRRASYNKN